ACTSLISPVIWVGVTNIYLPQDTYTWYDPAPPVELKCYRVLFGPTPIGSSAWETTPIGAVVSDNFDRDSLGTNWIILTNASATVVSNQLFFNQTNLNYSRQVYYQPWQTCSDEWTISWNQRFDALDANSRGVGVGIKNFQIFGGTNRGYNALLCGSGTNLGKM